MIVRTDALEQTTVKEEIEWDKVYAEQLPRVYNFFRYRVGDGQSAEDLTATTFEKAWRSRQRYRRDLGAFSTWLFAIARNAATDHLRKQRPELALDNILGKTSDESLEEIAQIHSDFERLDDLLARLPARERELIALKYGADLTNRQIAKLAGLSESNVGTILHRVVQRLRGKWEEIQ